MGWGGVGQGRRRKNEVNTIGKMHACGQQNTFGSKKSQSDHSKDIIFIIQHTIFCILVNRLPQIISPHQPPSVFHKLCHSCLHQFVSVE